jgi:hypothetical protein
MARTRSYRKACSHFEAPAHSCACVQPGFSEKAPPRDRGSQQAFNGRPGRGSASSSTSRLRHSFCRGAKRAQARPRLERVHFSAVAQQTFCRRQFFGQFGPRLACYMFPFFFIAISSGQCAQIPAGLGFSSWVPSQHYGIADGQEKVGVTSGLSEATALSARWQTCQC